MYIYILIKILISIIISKRQFIIFLDILKLFIPSSKNIIIIRVLKYRPQSEELYGKRSRKLVMLLHMLL